MFTGLVQEVGRISSIREIDGKRRLTIAARQVTQELKIGESVAVSGVCLTAVDVTPESVGFDLAEETWTRTSFSRLTEGAYVNLELPLAVNARMGGHIVQGHVDGTGTLIALEPIPGAQDFWLHIEVPWELEKYLVFKGSIAIEGISLTVAKLEGNKLTIAIIPHTVTMTNLQSLEPGDPVNIETDIVAKYLEKWTFASLHEQKGRPGQSSGRAAASSSTPSLQDFLAEQPAAPELPRGKAGALDARGKRFGLVVSRFNSVITERLLQGALDALRRTGGRDDDLEIVRVPGAFEIAAAARQLALTGRFDALICLGCLLRGDTLHYEVIANEATRAIGQSAQDTGVPHAFGVLTCDTLEQAIDRAGLKSGNKGFDAALAAVEMASLKNL
jgi:riboflavin synthase alpha subunit/6,7-dimethyl-8-ribityllumazine synthase